MFISYSTKDKKYIDEIVEDLNENGIRYWLDEDRIGVGDEILERIEHGLAESCYLLACFSHNQLKSGWCRMEYSSILTSMFSGKSNQKVMPLILDDLPNDKLPPSIRIRKYVRYSDREGYRKLLQQLKMPFSAPIKVV